MPTRLNPYLNFSDKSSEVMDFYQTVFGGKLDKDTFGENNMAQDPADADKIMHAMLVTDNGLVLMAADTPSSMETHPNGTLSLSGDDETELRGYWEKLSDGGAIVYPLEKAPWGDTFGMCTDKFGIGWMVNISGQATEA
jgi:PhnB protein